MLWHANAKLKGIPSLTPPNTSSPWRGCQLSKAHEREFPASSKQATFVLDLIHTDLCAMPTFSHSHNKWIIIFIDDASGFAALHFLPSKADAVHCFKDLVSGADTQTGYQLKSVCSDQ